jgi:hypothetical protein
MSLESPIASPIIRRMSTRLRMGATAPRASLSQVTSLVMEANIREGRLIFNMRLAIVALASSLNHPALLANAPKMLKEKIIKTRQKMLTVEIELAISCS